MRDLKRARRKKVVTKWKKNKKQKIKKKEENKIKRIVQKGTCARRMGAWEGFMAHHRGEDE